MRQHTCRFWQVSRHNSMCCNSWSMSKRGLYLQIQSHCLLEWRKCEGAHPKNRKKDPSEPVKSGTKSWKVGTIIRFQKSFDFKNHYMIIHRPTTTYNAKAPVVLITLCSDPLQIRILWIWRSVFNIHADTDNLNPIICGRGVGYGISEIRRI